jgi:serine/threonine-protein kinase
MLPWHAVTPSRDAPKSFGKYRPIAELGRGGMAIVYLAASLGPRGFSKLVVVKELKEEFCTDAEFTAMFVDEARLAARLNHPNIVQTYEVEEHGSHFFIVMEYLEGQPLSQTRSRLARLGAQLRDHQVRVLCDVLDALHHAHDLADYDGRPLHVVHRDVSPHNIIVTYAGDAKLVDFGIAKAADSTSQTRTGVIKGKLAYMSPEQAFGKAVDRRADVFSVGVILWEAITGRRMWKGMAEGAIAHRLSLGDVPRITDFVPEPPMHLKAICERALAPRLEERYPSAVAMRHDLEAYLAQQAHRPVAREFGALVAQGFVEERARLTSLIEQQMMVLRDPAQPGPSGAELPRVNLAIPSITPNANTPSTSGGRRDVSGVAASSTSGARDVAPPADPSTVRSVRAGYPLRWLVLGGIALVLAGAAVTTAVMAPWSTTGAPGSNAVTGDAQTRE